MPEPSQQPPEVPAVYAHAQPAAASGGAGPETDSSDDQDGED
jgi:hypothetical protein